MATCVCGYTHAHIQHECWRETLKPHTRCDVMPRCKCGFLHAHIEHDCSTFPERPKFVEEPETMEQAIEQWANGWRPVNMCGKCPSLTHPCQDCWVRAGYSAESYSETESEAAKEARFGLSC